MRRGVRAVISGALTTALVGGMLVLASALPASATVVTPGGDPDTDVDHVAADLEIIGLEHVSTVLANQLPAPPVSPTAYPAGSFSGSGTDAALIVVRDTASLQQSRAFCVDLDTTTYAGIDYSNSDWTTAGVPNSSYIVYILLNYPWDAVPVGSRTAEVAAIQAAIWFFSDGLVLTSGDPARPRTTTIVDDAILNGGATPPPTPPTLTVTPADAEAPSTGELTGPFTVSGNATGATVLTIDDLDLYLDAAGTVPAAVGTPAPPGTQFWVGNAVSILPPASFSIGLDFTIPVGTVYLADPDPDAYQKLVLAQQATLPVRAGASVSVYSAGSVTVTQRIEGPAAGDQGAITLLLSCDLPPAASVTRTFTVPAGTAAGDRVFTASALRAGATCTVTQTASGANARAIVSSSTITPANVLVPAAPAPAAQVLVVTRYTLPLPATGIGFESNLAAGLLVLLVGGLLLGGAPARVGSRHPATAILELRDLRRHRFQRRRDP